MSVTQPSTTAPAAPRSRAYAELVDHSAVLSVHFVEGDPELSKPVTVTGPHPGSGDRYVLVECSGAEAAKRVAAQFEKPIGAYGELVEVMVYRFRMDLCARSLQDSAIVSVQP
ncbi:MAG: hypothetical protein JSS14_23025 [Proteobacteria bacterium]|nr:hypothetical protein [Pseudomonadota bacterium]